MGRKFGKMNQNCNYQIPEAILFQLPFLLFQLENKEVKMFIQVND